MDEVCLSRTETADQIDSLMEPFIGETLFVAAETLADSQGLELDEVVVGGRPLTLRSSRPTQDGEMSCSLAVNGVENNSRVNLEMPVPLSYTLRRSEVVFAALNELTDMQRAGLMAVLQDNECVNQDVVDLLCSPDESTLKEKCQCAIESVEEFCCDQDLLTATKETGVNYFFNGECVLSVGVDAPETGERDGIDPVLQAYADDMAQPASEDIRSMKEILYYLNLPGGEISSDVTYEYVEEDYRYV